MRRRFGEGLTKWSWLQLAGFVVLSVGMLMFKIKELVKVSHKSEIWSEDIGNLREKLDKERKVRKRMRNDD